MFQRGLRRLRRDERGQALVVGAIAMLVLALVVLSSVSIGHGIYSKIKLQDAADAQSYTIAVKEARAYNFLAYTNRAMVVHYNAMLTMMAYVSHAFYLKETIGRIAGFLKYVPIPVVSQIFTAVEKVIDAWMKIVDGIAMAVVPLLTALNVALWLAQEAVIYATLLDLVTSTSSDAVKITDPKAQIGFAMNMSSVGGASGGLSNIVGINLKNLANFLHIIDDGVHSSDSDKATSFGSMIDPAGTAKRAKLLGDNKLSDPQMAKYRLLMGNITNSARRVWTAIGEKPYIVGRKWKIKVTCLLTFEKGAEGEIKSFDETHDNNVKDQLFAEDWVSFKIDPCLLPKIFEFRYRMQAKADRNKGGHAYALFVEVAGDTVVDETVGKASNSDHHMFAGITPFYTSDPSFLKPYNYHFGYPCNLVVTSKDMIGKRQVFELSGKFMEGQGSADMEKSGMFDMTWANVAGDGFLAEGFRQRTGGMMAVSVGRAIYHRPGDWKEEPNFFNPLWTARLAPVKTHWNDPTDEATNPELAFADKIFSAVNY